MKNLLIALALVGSLAVAQEVKKHEDKKHEQKSEMKKDGKDKHAGMPHHKYSGAAATQWGPGPASLPAGAQAAVLEGDPTKPGEFTLRIKVPAGYKIPPHWHPATEHVTLISGETYIGMGDKWDESKGQRLTAGDFIYMAANSRHFAWAKSESVLQLHGTGPWKIIYVNPADNPAPKK
ncbi:MAG: cupin domain-containing protein [Terriglobales bacterium]